MTTNLTIEEIRDSLLDDPEFIERLREILVEAREIDFDTE